PPMQLDDSFNEGKSDAKSAVVATRSLLLLAKHFKGVWHELRCDTFTGIRDSNHCVVRLGVNCHSDVTTHVGEFHGIRKNIHKDLQQSAGIRFDRQRLVYAIKIELDPFAGSCFGYRVYRRT